MEFVSLQLELLTQQAMRAGFTGGLVVDYPNSTKAKKYKFHSFFTHSEVIYPCFVGGLTTVQQLSNDVTHSTASQCKI